MATVAPDTRPPRLARRMYLRFGLAAVVIVLSTTGAVATAALLEVKDDVNIIKKFSKPIAGINAPGILDGVSAGGPQTILILGSDRRFVDIEQHNPTRSDTIILLRLDPDKHVTAILSLPRDLRVPIPGFQPAKINAAYADGGPKLTVRTVKALLGGLPINHVVNVNFGGFQRAVNRVGCVYGDIDRRYFNDNDPPAGGGGDYSVIDIKAGYQKLCGADALSFVRYRHFDSDIVRGARQQQFLAQAKEQIGVGKLFSDRKNLIEIFGRYTQTDIRGTTAVLRLLKLAVSSAKNPIQRVQIPDIQESGPDLVASASAIAEAKRDFLDARGTSPSKTKAKTTAADRRRTKRHKRSHGAAGIPPGLFADRKPLEDAAAVLDVKVPFPVYFPKDQAVGATLQQSDDRAYDIYDRGHHRYRAYRMVFSYPGVGQYFGVQGMSWKAPPILDDPDETRHMGGRAFQLYYDAGRLSRVAWSTPKGVYWVSNTLLQSLTNKQMLGLAQSLTRVGGP